MKKITQDSRCTSRDSILFIYDLFNEMSVAQTKGMEGSDHAII
jgi:hypothetical protein